MISSGHPRGALESCPLMHMEKSSSWDKAVRQKDLRSVFFFCDTCANTSFKGNQIIAIAPGGRGEGRLPYEMVEDARQRIYVRNI